MMEVPEPGSLTLLTIALIAIATVRSRTLRRARSSSIMAGAAAPGRGFMPTSRSMIASFPA
jgi:hypothetical protein